MAEDTDPVAPRERQEPTRTPEVDRQAQAAQFRSNTDAVNNESPTLQAAQSYVNAAQNIARSAFPDDPDRQRGYVEAVKENAASSVERGDDIKPFQVDRASIERAREEVREDRERDITLER